MRRSRYEIATADREWVTQVGWRSVDDVLNWSAGGVAAVSRSSDVVEVPIDPDLGGPKTAFVKRYRYDRLEQRLKQAFRGTLFGLSRGRREYDFLNEMRRRHVPTVRPIAYGDHYGIAFLRASFLITEGVEGFQSLDLFAINALRRKPMPRKQRRALIDGLAATLRQMHDAGVRHGGLYWRNILIRVEDNGGFSFLLIDPDTHGRFSDGRIPDSDVAFDLGEVVASGMGLGLRAGLKPLIQAYYQTARLSEAQRKLLDQVVSIARELARAEQRRMAITEVIGWLRERTDQVESGRHSVRAFESLEAFFSAVAGTGHAKSATASMQKVIRFAFSGAHAAHDRTVTLGAGPVTVAPAAPAGKADLKIRTDPDTLLAVVSGHPEAYPRLRAGRLRIEGDPTVLCTLIEHVDQSGTGSSPAAVTSLDATGARRPHAETAT